MHSPALIVICAFCNILLLLALPIHMRTRNTGALLLIAWLFCGNVFGFVNPIIFWDSAANVAPVWCDISIRFSIAFPSALAASSLCIHRQLASIAASRSIGMTRRQRRTSLIIDLICGLGIPMCMMALAYIVQAHRLDTLEGMSPVPPYWECLATLFLIYVPPLLICIVSLFYGIVAMRFFIVHRMRFHALLKASHSGLDTSNYLRLMAIAGADLLMSLPLSITFLVARSQGLKPWTSWDEIHEAYSRVGEISVLNLPVYWGRPGNFAVHAVGEWLSPLLTMTVFILFGVSDEAIRGYARILQRLARFLGIRKHEVHSSVPFQPSLGSKVVNAAGSRWVEADSTVGEEHGPQVGDSAPSNTVEMGERSERGTIAVTVERDVV